MRDVCCVPWCVRAVHVICVWVCCGCSVCVCVVCDACGVCVLCCIGDKPYMGALCVPWVFSVRVAVGWLVGVCV